MATASSDSWKVIISAEDEALDKIYRLSPDTQLNEVMTKWALGLGVIGNYVFKSDDRSVEYDIDCSLRDVGETSEGSRTVLLAVELSLKPTPKSTRNIFVVLNGRMQHYTVRPSLRLKNIIPNSSHMTFMHNGKLLQRSRTIRQLGIPENGIITTVKTVTVELSEGCPRKVSVQEGSLACHLKKELKQFENEDFFLKSNEKVLLPDQSLSGLSAPLNLCRPEFEVAIAGKTYRWRISGGRMVNFEDFSAYLASASGLNRMKLSQYVYICDGCGRRVRKEEEEFQLFNIDCCRLRSLRLKAKKILASKDTSADGLLTVQKKKYSRLLTEKKRIEKDFLRSVKSFEDRIQNLNAKLTQTQFQLSVVTTEKEALQKALDDLRNIPTKDLAVQYPLPSPTRPLFQNCPKCDTKWEMKLCYGLYFTCCNCGFNFCAFCTRPFSSSKQPCKVCGDRSRGIHAHHPRNCLHFLRDLDIPDLWVLVDLHNQTVEELLPRNTERRGVYCGLEHFTDFGETQKCRTVSSDQCQGYCHKHFKQLLIRAIYDAGEIDPIAIMTEDQLRCLATREGVDFDIEDISLQDMRTLLKLTIPLVEDDN